MAENKKSSELSRKSLSEEEINSTLKARTELEAQTNISKENLESLKDIASSNQIGIILRPVNQTALALMSQGAEGKNMFVHGKSSTFGPTNGLIPVNSSISKAGSSNDKDKIATYNAQNEHSLHHSADKFAEIEAKLTAVCKGLGDKNLSEEEKIALLTKAHIAEEEFDPLVSKVKLQDKNGRQLFIFEDTKGLALQNKSREPIYAIKENGQFKALDANHQSSNEPLVLPKEFRPTEVEVLGKPIINIKDNGEIEITDVKPFTADIDVLAYGAKVALDDFNNVKAYDNILQENKKRILSETSLHLSESDKEILTKHSIHTINNDKRIKASISPEVLSSELFKELKTALRREEVNVEHLKGIGQGTDVILDIVGHMRGEFKNGEISHGPEQFNLDFTQPLDKEWVVISPKNGGEVTVIQGEKNLLATFNEFKKDGFSMPPNPNWGWKLTNDQSYEIDPELRAIHAKAGDLNMQLSSATPEEKQQIKQILSDTLELGIKSISVEKNEEAIVKLKASLTKQIDVYLIDKGRGGVPKKHIEEMKQPLEQSRLNQIKKDLAAASQDVSTFVGKMQQNFYSKANSINNFKVGLVNKYLTAGRDGYERH